MHSFERGFLSEPFDEVRHQVRLNHQSWHALLHEVNIIAVELQYQITVHSGEPRELFGAVLFSRILSSSQAAVILLEHGLVAQARCVLRSALEALFSLGAIATKPKLVDRLIEAHKAEQQRAAKNITLWRHPDLKAIAAEQLDSGKLAEFLIDESKSISAFELAEAGGYEDWYRSLYMTLSWSAHGAAIDLERHMVKDDDDFLVEMQNEPDTQHQEVAWLVAIEIQIKAVFELAEIFPSVDKLVFEQYESKLHALASALND